MRYSEIIMPFYNRIVDSTPGGGLSLVRLLCISALWGGVYLLNVPLIAFLGESLEAVGSARYIAYLPFALGKLLSIPFSALIHSFGSMGYRHRQKAVFCSVLLGALCIQVLTYWLKNPRFEYIWGCVILGTAFSSLTQSCPSSGMLHDTSKMAGDSEHETYRRLLATSTLYFWENSMSVVAAVVLLVAANRLAECRFYITTFSVYCSLLMVTVSLLAAPTEMRDDSEQHSTASHDPERTCKENDSRLTNQSLMFLVDRTAEGSSWDTVSLESTSPQTEINPSWCRESEASRNSDTDKDLSYWATVRAHFRFALTDADRHLFPTYISTLFFSIAMGSIDLMKTSFFNEQVFRLPVGSMKGVRFSAAATLINYLLKLAVEATWPMVVFRKEGKGRYMNWLWPAGALLGSASLGFLAYVSHRELVAVVLFGFLGVSYGSHKMFSNFCAGGNIDSRYRGTAFGTNSAFEAVGYFFGAILGATTTSFVNNGSIENLKMASVSLLISGIVATLSGNVTSEEVDGLKVNANILFRRVFGLNEPTTTDIVRKNTNSECTDTSDSTV